MGLGSRGILLLPLRDPSLRDYYETMRLLRLMRDYDDIARNIARNLLGILLGMLLDLLGFI